MTNASHQPTLQLVPIESIKTVGNTRQVVRDAAFDELVADIKARDIQSPPRARRVGDQLVLTFGHRRLEAAKVAGRTHIPLLIDDEPLSDGDRTVLRLSENLHRQDLNPVEFGDAVARLIRETQWSPTDVAEHLHTSGSRISRALALAGAPPMVRNAVLAGQLGGDAGYRLTLIPDDDRRAELLNGAMAGEVTRDQIAEHVRADRRERKAAGKTLSATALAGRVAESVRTKVTRATAHLDAGRSVTVSARDLTLARFIECLESLLARCRKSRDLELSTFLRITRDQAKPAKAGA